MRRVRITLTIAQRAFFQTMKNRSVLSTKFEKRSLGRNVALMNRADVKSMINFAKKNGRKVFAHRLTAQLR